MTDESLRASTVIAAPAEAVFAVLADPVRHADVDGTGRVTGALDTAPLTRPGQVFRMGMHHPDHPDGTYVTANRVAVLDPPRAIAWQPGPDVGADGVPHPGGWVWRYDLRPAGPSATEVVLTYDWSAVPASVRAYLAFPPFPVSHLDESLGHLAELVTGR